MTVAENQHDDKGHGQDEKKLDVAIVTTSGFYPGSGFLRVPANQKVEIELKKAAIALNLTDTSNWVASVKKRPIDPNKSYTENSLSGEVEIDWGPREGGGGSCNA